MAFFAGVDAAGFVEVQFEFFGTPADDGVGPPSPVPVGEYTYYEIPGMLRDLRPTKTSMRMWVDGAMAWVEQARLADTLLSHTLLIDQAAEAARARVISQPTNTEEYHVAAADATAWRSAGYAGAAPESVASWADAKRRRGWTNQQAAEDILATADQWRGLLLGIRRLRLNAKELVRDATTSLEADLALETFLDSLTTMLPPLQ